MKTILNLLFTISIIAFSFNVHAQTSPNDADIDKAQKEMSEGFEQIFEMMDSSTFQNLFNGMDIQQMLGDLDMEEMMQDLNFSEMMGEMKIDTMLQNFNMNEIMGQLDFNSGEMQEMMKLGMDMMKDMDMTELQQMMEAFGGQFQDLKIEEKLKELGDDKERKKI